MKDFRILERGGVWWLERFQDGAWTIFNGPYKRRAGAEARLRKEVPVVHEKPEPEVVHAKIVQRHPTS